MNNQSLLYHSVGKKSMQTTLPANVDLFLESIKSPATKGSYKQALRQFEKDTGFKLDKETTDAKALQTYNNAAIVVSVGKIDYEFDSNCGLTQLILALL